MANTKGLLPQRIVQEATDANHIAISAKTYARLKMVFPGVSDDHSFQRLLKRLLNGKAPKLPGVMAILCSTE